MRPPFCLSMSSSRFFSLSLSFFCNVLTSLMTFLLSKRFSFSPHDPWRLFELVHWYVSDVDRDVDLGLVQAVPVQVLADVVPENGRGKSTFLKSSSHEFGD